MNYAVNLTADASTTTSTRPSPRPENGVVLAQHPESSTPSSSSR